MDAPLAKAIELLGGQAPLASAIGVKQQHVSNWLNRGKGRVPAEYCPAIERATGGRVRCEDLRRDVPWEVLREQALAKPEGEHAAASSDTDTRQAIAQRPIDRLLFGAAAAPASDKPANHRGER